MRTTPTEAVPVNGSSPARGPWASELLVLRGDDRPELLARVRAVADFLRRQPPVELVDLAYTLNTDLAPGGCRLALVAATVADAAGGLDRAAKHLADPGCTEVRATAGLYFAARPLHPGRKIAFLFPGEGAQYLGMLRDVREAFPAVASFLAGCDAQVAPLAGEERPLTGAFLLPEGAGAEERARAEQGLRQFDKAMLTALMADGALYLLLGQLGLAPDVLAGHSIGELAALSAAGCMEVDAHFVGHLHETMRAMRHEGPGADAVLLAVGTGTAALRGVLAALGAPPVYVAMDNCPHQAVVVGPPEPMAALRDELHRRRLVCERLPFNHPYHTPLFEPMLGPMRGLLDAVRFRPPRRPVYSCTTARPFPEDPDGIRRLAVAHWAAPVRFTELVETLHADGVRLFVECGPRGNLAVFVEDILHGRDFAALPADVARRPGLTQLNHLLGRLAAHNVSLRLAPLYEARSPRRLDDLRALLRSAPAPDAPMTVPGPPAKPEPPVAGGPTNAYAAVVAEYFGLMGQFVRQQRDMMELFLRCRQSPRPAGGGDPRAVTASRPPATHPSRPLLGTFVRHVPGRELVTRRVLDLREDLFATDHTVGGREVSKVDPDQHGVPVMPMTFTLEMMAEAAAVLAPGKVVTEVRDVRLHRWLAFDAEEPPQVELTARLAPAGNGTGPLLIDVQVREPDAPDAAKKSAPLTAEGTVVLRDQYPPSPPPGPPGLTNERPSSLTVAQTYRNLFHGPLFQGVRSNERVGDEGIESRIEVLPREGLFRSTREPNFLLDPVLLDVVLHPLAAWHLEQPDQAGRILLPVGLRCVEVFGPPPAPGTPLTARGWVRETTPRSFLQDGEVLADDGTVWARLHGLTCWRFYVPFGEVNFHGPKDQYFLGEHWRRAEGQLRPPAGGCAPFALVRLAPPADLQQAAMLRVTAQVTLTPKEMRAFRRQLRGGPEARRRLFDRIAAKDAVRLVWHALTGERLFPADIEAEEEAGGRYRARRRGAAGEFLPPAAVDRAGGFTAAVAAAGAAVGLALAVVGQPGEADELPLDPEEERLVAAWGADRTEVETRFRCARRAVARATQSDDGRTVPARIRAADPRGGIITVAALPPDGDGCEEAWQVSTGRDGDVIIAWTAREGGPR
jgi:malonyl CoA-acyl carrier protein transacylase